MTRSLINLRYAWNWRKPAAMSRLAWNVTLAGTGQNRLRYVDLSIGTKCNIKCGHCFAQYEPPEHLPGAGRIPPAAYADIVKECMQLGAVNFSFQGGEPLCYPDLVDYVRAAQPGKNLISISTNGTLVTYEKAKELLDWGVDILTVSLDSYRPAKSLDGALRGIDNAIHAGLKVTIATVVTHDTLHTKFTQMVLNEGRQGKNLVLIIFPVPLGRWEGKEVLLPDEDIKYVRDLEREFPWIRTDLQANYIRHGCGAAKEILYITPSGYVYCCPFIPIRFGNVRDSSITEIRNRMLQVDCLAEYAPYCLAGERGVICKKF